MDTGIIFILICSISSFLGCGSQCKITSDIKQYFGATQIEDNFEIAETEGIGILHFTRWGFVTNSVDFFNMPSNTARFATLSFTSEGHKWKPSQNFKQFFNPLSNYLAGSYKVSLLVRVLEYDCDWMKIVFDETEQRTCYIKNEYQSYTNGYGEFNKNLFDDSFQTWESYFLGEERIRTYKNNETNTYKPYSWHFIRPLIQIDLPLDENLPLYDIPNGKIIPVEDRSYLYEFFPLEMQGEWLRVEFYFPPENMEGWIRWRNGRKILVKIVEEWGIE